MTLTAELYFSFRSPYSYLSVGRYRAMAEEHDLDIALRPVWPLAIREPDFFERNHPNWLAYTLRDMMRVAQFHGIPFGPPRPDPIVQDAATRKIAAEQPYIRRVTRMGQAASRRGRGLVFAHEAGQLIWGGRENWHEGDHLAGALERAGLDAAEIDREVAAEEDTLDAEIAANQDALEASGHWGVPTLVFEGEPFFGQDRIEMARWRMEQRGLAKKSAVSSAASEDEVRRKIQREYERGGHSLGWSYIYSTRASRENPQLVTIGLNPGGGRTEEGWHEDAHLIYADDGGTVNAYLDQDWTGDGSPTPLQSQIRLLRDRNFPDVQADKMLSFQLVPFRSPSWDEMPNGELDNALTLGIDLLDWTLTNLSPEATVVTFGLQALEYEVADWFKAYDQRFFDVGWGRVTARVWSTPKAKKLIFLPHLSRYRIFGRPEFTNEEEIFA